MTIETKYNIGDEIKSLRNKWNDACLSLGIPSLTKDTCARIMAVLFVHGNNEAFVLNNHFVADAKYIQERFCLYGTGIPTDFEFINLLKGYIKELDEYNETNKNKVEGCLFSDAKPEWAIKLFKEMYNIKI